MRKNCVNHSSLSMLTKAKRVGEKRIKQKSSCRTYTVFLLDSGVAFHYVQRKFC